MEYPWETASHFSDISESLAKVGLSAEDFERLVQEAKPPRFEPERIIVEADGLLEVFASLYKEVNRFEEFIRDGDCEIRCLEPGVFIIIRGVKQ